eukprot:3750195-Rhodomonas_salina.1
MWAVLCYAHGGDTGVTDRCTRVCISSTDLCTLVGTSVQPPQLFNPAPSFDNTPYLVRYPTCLRTRYASPVLALLNLLSNGKGVSCYLPMRVWYWSQAYDTSQVLCDVRYLTTRVAVHRCAAAIAARAAERQVSALCAYA